MHQAVSKTFTGHPDFIKSIWETLVLKRVLWVPEEKQKIVNKRISQLRGIATNNKNKFNISQLTILHKPRNSAKLPGSFILEALEQL